MITAGAKTLHGGSSVGTTNYILPFKAPIPSPSSVVTIVTFNSSETLIAYIQQDVHHHHFKLDGLSSEWTAADEGKSKSHVHEEDHDKIALDVKLEQEQITMSESERRVAVRLTSRNFLLPKSVSHVATSSHTDNDAGTNLHRLGFKI